MVVGCISRAFLSVLKAVKESGGSGFFIQIPLHYINTLLQETFLPQVLKYNLKYVHFLDFPQSLLV